MFAKKVVLIGIDAPITKSIQKYVKQGKLPNFSKLIENGVWAENCLVPHPTITPPNWTTIVTGAWPGTHGITCFHLHKPGMNLNEAYQAFDSRDCSAEYIWEKAELVGKKSIVLNYPTTWPPRMKNGIQIAGGGLHVNEWRFNFNGVPDYRWNWYSTIADEQLFSVEEYPLSDVIKFKKSSNWKNLPAEDFVETEITVGYRNCYEKVDSQKWFLLFDGKENVFVSEEKDFNKAFIKLKKGQWSEKIEKEFLVNGKPRKIIFMAKFINSSDFKLYFTPLCQFEGWSYPESIAGELKEIDGLPFRAMEDGLHLEWYDLNTYIERLEMETKWLGESAYYLLKNKEWDMLFMHAHAPDHSYHGFINKLEPMNNSDKNEIKKFEEAEAKFYIDLDKMIGRILEATDENTLIMIVSDHGAVPTERYYNEQRCKFDIFKILTDAGLIVYKKDEQENSLVDWTKTRAYPQRSVYVYVNLKGRDPDGSVEQGQEYEKVCDEIINAIYNYTDSVTGKKPAVFALRKRDARILGLYGDRIGDVVYGLNPEVEGEHGRQVTTGEYGIGSMKGLLIIKGPNINKNQKLTRSVWLTDVVPTICYSLGIPIPKDTEGAIIYQAFENPNFQIEQIKTLEKNYERTKRAIDGQKALTHDY